MQDFQSNVDRSYREVAARRRTNREILAEYQAMSEATMHACDDSRRLLRRVSDQFPQGLPSETSKLADYRA